MATIAAIAGAAASAYAANRQAAAAKKAGKGAGEVDIRHENTPWGPSEQYRLDAMARANALAENGFPGFDQWNARRSSGWGGQDNRDPRPGRPGQTPRGPGGGTGGGGGRPGGPEGTSGQLPIGKPPRVPGLKSAVAGGGSGSPAAAPFNGVSGETQEVRDAMIARAREGNPLYDIGEDYIGGTLRGEDANKYREETFGALRDVGDEDLDRYKAMLFEQLEGGGGGAGGGIYGGGGGSFRGSGYAYSPGGGGAGSTGGVADYLKPILEGDYLKEGNPYLEERIKQVLADANETYDKNKIAGLNSQYSGAGMLGSTFYSQALADSAKEKATGLAGASGQLRFEDYDKRMNDFLQAAALQAQIEGDERAAGAASASAGASAGAAADRLALERQMGLLNALGGAIGQGVDLRQFGLSGMAGLSEGFGQDQRFALEGLPTVSGLSMRDWGAAGDLSLGADELQGRYDLGRRDIQGRNAAANRANNLARQQFNFDVFRDERGYPLVREGGVADIINAMSGQYGTSHEYGTDRRSVSPYSGPSPTSAAIAGGIAGGVQGYNFGSQFGNSGGSAPSGSRDPEPWLGS